MDVNRVNGNGYAPSPPPPMPGSGEFAPAPPPEQIAPEVYMPAQAGLAPAPVESPRAERAERESTDTLRGAVNEINSSIAIHRRHLGIRHHEATNRRIVTVYDSDTNEAIREIPPERVLEAHASMLEMVGLFMDTRG
ncbi:MAG: flagellar protein FlaG [Defluviitaleaceae bacterium]|nr:flagellar protein FlaG [Defluviitaleaceae bacterium]